MVDLDLQRQREAIRRSLLRANAYAIAILALVIGLAIAGLVQATRADRERNRATAAEQDAREKLWESYLGQARGRRASVQAGRRFESLEILQRAAAMRPSLDLRNEAIACLTLADLRLIRPPFALTNSKVCVDSAFQQYARVNADNSIRVCSLTDDRVLAELPPQDKKVELIPAFSPDGNFLVVYCQDGQLHLWDIIQRKRLVSVRSDRDDKAFDFSADSRTWLAIDNQQSMALFNTGTGQLIRKASPQEKWRRARFSPDGRLLAVSHEEKATAHIVRTDTWQVLHELRHANGVRAMAWSPDGSLIATAASLGKVFIWRLGEPEPALSLFAHQASAIEVDFHPNGQLLASAGWDGATRLWDVTTGELLVHLPETGDLLRFSRDGGRLTAFWGGQRRLWVSAVAGERICRFLARSVPAPSHGEDFTISHASVAFSPDDKLLAAAGVDGVGLWDAHKGEPIMHLAGKPALSAVFDPQQKFLISSGHDGVLSWPLDRLLNCNGINVPRPEKVASGSYNRTAISSEELAYVGGSQVYMRNSQQILQAMPGMSFVAISPDSQWVAAAAWYGNGGRLWERSTGKIIRDFAKGHSVGVKFTPDSRELIICAVEDFSFWNVETGQRGRSIPRRNTGGMFGMLAYSADGLLACAGSRTDVQLLEADSHAVLAQLELPNPQAIADLSFNSEGDHLAVATATPFLQLWNLKLMRRQLATLGLDWGQADPQATFTSKPVRGNSLFLILTLSGVALSICLAISVLNRQRKLMTSYRQIDQLAVHRSRELERAQSELLHSEKMRALGTLAAGIAHDFNNLLSVIRMANQLVERAVKPVGVTKENTDAIERAVTEGQLIVRSMLGYSRASATESQAYSLNTLVSETVTLLSKQFLSGIVLTLELDPKTPPVMGNKVRLEQILLNLIVNAAEAMNGNGTLCISLRPNVDAGGCILAPRTTGQYIELAVSDSGPGIAPEILPRIFEPFFTTKTVGATPGAGLGLSTVYTIAQQDGLGLAVDTEPGHGSTFRVIVPVNNQSDSG